MDLDLLKQKIFEIGSIMVQCSEQCSGISRNLEEGILPRCLSFETKGREIGKVGCAIIGINPGQAKSPEREFYQTVGQSYDSIVAYWNKHIGKLRYYNSLRRLVEQIGITGPILWTELVKCENSKTSFPTSETFDICTKTYLTKELNQIPSHWPLIAVSQNSFETLSSLYPTRIIIGVPHPTGSRCFSWLFDSNGELSAEYKILLDKQKREEIGKAIWLKTSKLSPSNQPDAIRSNDMLLTETYANDSSELLNRIKELLGPDFIAKKRKTGTTFWGYKGRILKLVDTKGYIKVEFNVPISNVSGVTLLTKEEAKIKKMGTCKWIYTGQNVDTVLNLVKEAISHY